MIKQSNEKNTETNTIRMQIPSLFTQIDTLTKLRIMVGLIVFLATMAIALVFIVDFFFAALAILLSYIVALVLFIKLLLIHQL